LIKKMQKRKCPPLTNEVINTGDDSKPYHGKSTFQDQMLHDVSKREETGRVVVALSARKKGLPQRKNEWGGDYTQGQPR